MFPENQTDKPRIFEFDCLRVIAIIAVIILHVSAWMVIKYPQESASYTAGNFFDSVSRFAVPFFVMISGYFMLDENYELPIPKLKKKIFKLMFLLIFWSFLYALIYSPHNFLNKLIYGHFHLWYLYLIIGLYLSLPILRLFVKNQNRKYVYYLIILGIIFLFLPNTLNAVFPPDNASKFFNKFGLTGGGYLVYFLFGWEFGNLNDKITKYTKWLTLITILSFVSIFCCTQFIYSNSYKTYEIFYNSVGLPVLFYSVSLFCILHNKIKEYLSKIPCKIKQLISKCSALSLGVYLIHVIFFYLYKSIFNNMTHDAIYIIFISFLVIISSFISVFLISKIKYLNQLIKI